MQSQRSETMDNRIIVSVITPGGEPVRFECDSLRLTVRDGRGGRGGGSYGIRRGHARAVISLGKGVLEAYLGGKLIRRQMCSEGFAKVEPDRVDVVVEHADKAEE